MKYLKTLLALILVTGLTKAQDSLFVSIDNDTVNIWNIGAYENCGFLVEMETIISNDTITIIEHDTSTQYAYCNCTFDMCATLTGLNPGNYHVDIYRTYYLIYDPDSLYYIGSTDFIYNGTASIISEKYYQSNCYDFTHIEKPDNNPQNFVLLKNYPNPFNPVTKLSYSIPFPAFVNLTVYNILGKEIVTLVNDNLGKGTHITQFDGSSLSSGIYFVKLRVSEKFTKTIKIILMK